MKLTVGTITDRGLNPKRTANEDRLLALSARGVFLVADGVGGRRAGETASQTVVDVFTEVFSRPSTADLRLQIEGAIIESNRRIFAASVETPGLSGMATTIAVLALDGGEALIGHVGDSRIYRYESGTLSCETEDHNEVNEAVRAGLLNPALAAHDPRRNVITRAIGVEPDVEADYSSISAHDGARFLLCSDGVTRHIPDAELQSLLAHDLHPESLCQQLKEICYRRGAEDNLTAIIVDLGARAYQGAEQRSVNNAGTTASEAAAAAPGSRIEVDWRAATAKAVVNNPPPRAEAKAGPQGGTKKKSKGLIGWVILAIIVALAFVIGRNYDQVYAWAAERLAIESPSANATTQVSDPELAAARVLFEEKRYEKAREQLVVIAQKRPESAETHFWLGRTHLEMKDYPKAVEELNEAARLNAQLPDVYLYLARAYEGVGDRRKMDEALRRATAR
jgi:protein phosphatase